jgi:hypothetical protein
VCSALIWWEQGRITGSISSNTPVAVIVHAASYCTGSVVTGRNRVHSLQARLKVLERSFSVVDTSLKLQLSISR